MMRMRDTVCFYGLINNTKHLTTFTQTFIQTEHVLCFILFSPMSHVVGCTPTWRPGPWVTL